MIRRAAPAVFGLLGLCLPLAAQQAVPSGEAGAETGPAVTLYQPDIFSTVDSSVLIHSLPVPTIWEGGRLPVSLAPGPMSMASLGFLPVAFMTAVQVPRSNAYPVSGKDGPMGVVDSRLSGVYVGGEVGVFYGSSSGKFGGNDFQTYIEGTVGNDKLQITAGAAYEQSNVRIPRR